MFKVKLKEIMVLLVISLISGFLFNNYTAYGIEYVNESIKLQDGAVISLYDAKKIYDEKSAIFIDARPEQQYQRSHIKGAINIPYRSREKEKLTNNISKNENIIVYCYSKSCNQARILAKDLQKLGFLHVIVFEGGYSEWNKAKYPLESETQKQKN